MSQQTLERLLSGSLPDPDGNGVLTVPVRSVVIDCDLARAAPDLVSKLDLGVHVSVVMDPASAAAMGNAVLEALAARYRVSPIIMELAPHPDMDAVRRVMAQVARADGLIAVGSGSINDITKHAAHLTKKPYAVFGTAPSMNGYTSVSAAITEDGLKKSLASTAPRGVFLDLAVLAAAPKRLIAAGFGDSICRATAQTDWLLSHLLMATHYREAPFALLAEDEAALVANAAGLMRSDRSAIALLAHTLVMSGFGMTICGDLPRQPKRAPHCPLHGHAPAPICRRPSTVSTSRSRRCPLHAQEHILGQQSLRLRPSSDSRRCFMRHSALLSETHAGIPSQPSIAMMRPATDCNNC